MTEIANTISLEALKAGDREAFARLVDGTSAHIYRVAVQILGNDPDAEDLLQETYIKAYRASLEFEGRSSLTTWLYRIAVNEALMLVRKRKPQAISVEENPQFVAEAESEGMEIVDFCCLPDGELQAELCAEIEAHLKDCDNCRVVVNSLRKTVELYEQTSEPVGLPQSVRERLFLKLELSDFLKIDWLLLRPTGKGPEF